MTLDKNLIFWLIFIFYMIIIISTKFGVFPYKNLRDILIITGNTSIYSWLYLNILWVRAGGGVLLLARVVKSICRWLQSPYYIEI